LEKKVIGRIKEELAVEDISIQKDIALVMLVGEGMRNTIGIAARATGALRDASINLEMINQGASELSMMFGVNANKSEAAVKALYKEFFK
jgi:aspartate kinase